MTAMRAGECVSLIGLSGMGKSNLLGFITFRVCPKEDDVLCILLDCNRLPSFTSGAFFHLANLNLKSQVKGTSIDGEIPEDDGFDGLHHAISSVTMETGRKVLFLIDGFDDLTASVDRQFFNLLRSLRDGHKYMLSYLLATRRPLDVLAGWEKVREFNDLFVANQIWLGPLNDSDARWTVKRFEERHGKKFKKDEVLSLLELSGNHPGLLRVLAAAWHSMNTILPAVWLEHPAVIRECELLWDDLPEETRQNV
ncbi:MAG: hypothetical protein GTO18_15510, partial [Anaerolineales bacterium]|nr:hypothetical protein [Anaerolineales bacterium]